MYELERRGEGIGALKSQITKCRCPAAKAAQLVLDLLEQLPPSPIGKEDGEMAIDANTRRLL